MPMDTERLQARIEQLEKEVTQLKAQVKELNQFCFVMEDEEEVEQYRNSEEQELYREASYQHVPPSVVVEPPVVTEEIPVEEKEPLVDEEEIPVEGFEHELEPYITVYGEQIAEPVVEEPIAEPVVEVPIAEPVIEEPIAEPVVEEPVVTPVVKTSEPEVSWEARIVKYLPYAAAILIFIGLVLIGKLIQPHVTNGMKAIGMAAGSLALSVFGMLKMKKDSHMYKFYASLAGCGVGACYITALVSHFMLDVLPEMGLMACIGVWIAVVVLLSRYKSQIFAYICYLGILVAAGLVLFRWHDSSLGLWVYIISIVALVAANFSRDYKKMLWYFMQFPIVLTAMSLSYQGINLGAQCIIYSGALSVLLGQLLYYKDRVDKRMPFMPVVIFSMFAMGVCVNDAASYGEAARIGFNLLFSSTCVGLLGLCYRFFRQDECIPIYYLLLVITAIWLPIAYYGDTHRQWCGPFLVPALLTLGAGLALSDRTIRRIGYAYLAGFTLCFPSAMQFCLSESTLTNFNWGYFIYLALLIALLCQRKLRAEMADRVVLFAGIVWAFLIPYNHHVYDYPCLLLLLSCLALSINWRKYHALPNKATDIQFDTYTQYLPVGFTVVLAAMCLAEFASVDDVLALRHSGLFFFSLPIDTARILLSLMAFVLTLGQGICYRQRIYIFCSYATSLVFALLPHGSLPDYYVYGLYLVALIVLLVNVCRHYSLFDKLAVTALGIVALLLPVRYEWIGIFESWTLLSVLSLALHFSSYHRNPVVRKTEEISVSVVHLLSTLLIACGFVQLYIPAKPLFIGHELVGTECVTSCGCLTLLLVHTLGLGCLKQYRLYIVCAYALMAGMALIPADNIPNEIVYAYYMIALLVVIDNLRRHYSLYDKLIITFFCLGAIFLLWHYDWVHGFEVWVLCSVLSIVLHLTPYHLNWLTRQPEREPVLLRYGMNVALLALGMNMLRHHAEPLFIGHTLAGSEVVNTVLLVLMTLALSGLNVKRLYDEHPDSERQISIYTGLKFTLLLYFILERLSVESYMVTIAGILLALVLIIFGFRKQLKGLRLYGLVITMLCVVKLIFFDIVFDNEFYRPISFIVAGILLFAIFYVYFRLEKNNKEKQND